jgi:AraC family transcriptional regulator
MCVAGLDEILSDTKSPIYLGTYPVYGQDFRLLFQSHSDIIFSVLSSSEFQAYTAASTRWAGKEAEMQQKRSSIPSRVLTSAGLGWSGIEIARFIGHDELSIPPSTKHHAITHLNHRPLDLTQRLDGQRREERVHRGEVAIIPEGRAWEWGFKGETKSELLPLCLEDAFLREAARSADVDPEGVEILPILGSRDPRIEQIGLLLKEEIEAEGLLGGRLYAESLTTALAISLIRDHSSLGRKAARRAALDHAGGLSGRALKEVINYIGDNLEKDLTLAKMAGAVYMSPYHFSRLFKESTGFTPHHYVIERRVQRAEELLGGSALPVGEIALRAASRTRAT